MSVRRTGTRSARPNGVATENPPIRRSTTRKVAGGTIRRKKGYGEVPQGIQEIYPNESSGSQRNFEHDIVFVPGLGANPKESWKSSNTGFNWASNDEGLAKDFPSARVLLNYAESAWIGQLKVKQHIENLALSLLHGLQSARERSPKRPIVFIGHSMGGLVIAKAVVLSESLRNSFPFMFESIAACFFFGTPFNGSPAAAIAESFAEMGEKINRATSSQLLDLMKPGNEGLRALKNDFMRLVGKLNQKIELVCFYEVNPTDLAQTAGVSMFAGILNWAAQKYEKIVSEESATLDGIEAIGLESNHRNLVKFDGFKDSRYQIVRDPMKRIIQSAPAIVKSRLNSTRGVDRMMIKDILKVLDGAPIEKKRKGLEKTHTPSPWISQEREYLSWLGKGADSLNSADTQLGGVIWIHGQEGKGKTSASLAAINCIEEMIRDESKADEAPVLLAYFFCDSQADYSTAEALLRSLLSQLIDQQELLAPFAKHFIKNKSRGKDNASSVQAQASLTVDNLWQTLQDMLVDDELSQKKVYFVINNIHVLEDVDSTRKMLRLARTELQRVDEAHHNQVRVRWLFTSTESHDIEEVLREGGTRIINLDDNRYGNQIQEEMRQYAQTKISALNRTKKYNKTLAYYVSSLLGRRAENTQWIDIACFHLEKLPETAPSHRVRRILEELPRDLNKLLGREWIEILRADEDEVEKIKEMLRVLVLAYEDLTLSELGFLAELCSDDSNDNGVQHLIDRCRPLLSTKRDGKGEERICFSSLAARSCLTEHESFLGLSNEATKRQHGVMSIKSFHHLLEKFDFSEQDGPDGPDESTNIVTEYVEEYDEVVDDMEYEAGDEVVAVERDEIIEGYDSVEEEDEADSESGEPTSEEEAQLKQTKRWIARQIKQLENRALPYAVKYWLKHAREATPEIAEILSTEQTFWTKGSPLFCRWLTMFMHLTDDFHEFKGLDPRTVMALHVASSVGFPGLVAALLKGGYKSEMMERDGWASSPLHYAACFGHTDTVDLLLDQGANVDDGFEEGEQTPLHMTASNGNVKVMKQLLRRGARSNAVAAGIGPVINAAVLSGNPEAVKLLADLQSQSPVPFGDSQWSPLALAAMCPDLFVFETLIEEHADTMQAKEYEEAFLAAAEQGRIEVTNKLISRVHDGGCLQSALNMAAVEANWDIVKLLLDTYKDLNCESVLEEAATGSNHQEEVLVAISQHTRGSLPVAVVNKALYEATDREKEKTVKMLLETFHASASATGEEYGNALTASAFDGTINILKMLLDAGADPNSSDGWALQAAAGKGHRDVVEELLKRGAKVNAKTASPYFLQGTALQAACESGKDDIVALLLRHGANPNLGAGPDTCPIIAVASRGDENIIELLLSVNGKVKIDIFGGPLKSTPLIYAARWASPRSLQLLLDAGATINLPDNDGDTALITAARRGDRDCVKILLDNNADILHTDKQNTNALQAAVESHNVECIKTLVDRVSTILGEMRLSLNDGPKSALQRHPAKTNGRTTSLPVKPKRIVEQSESESVTGNFSRFPQRLQSEPQSMSATSKSRPNQIPQNFDPKTDVFSEPQDELGSEPVEIGTTEPAGTTSTREERSSSAPPNRQVVHQSLPEKPEVARNQVLMSPPKPLYNTNGLPPAADPTYSNTYQAMRDQREQQRRSAMLNGSAVKVQPERRHQRPPHHPSIPQPQHPGYPLSSEATPRPWTGGSSETAQMEDRQPSQQDWSLEQDPKFLQIGYYGSFQGSGAQEPRT